MHKRGKMCSETIFSNIGKCSEPSYAPFLHPKTQGIPKNTKGDGIAIKDCLVYYISGGGGLSETNLRVYTMEGLFVEGIPLGLDWPNSEEYITAMEWHPSEHAFLITTRTHSNSRWGYWHYDPDGNILGRVSYVDPQISAPLRRTLRPHLPQKNLQRLLVISRCGLYARNSHPIVRKYLRCGRWN